MTPLELISLGATVGNDGRAVFRLWAPNLEQVRLHVVAPFDRSFDMTRNEQGYHELALEDVGAGARYLYEIAPGRELPDPASRCQPEGVHGPSEIVAASFAWTDAAWRNRPLADHVFYELHIGTFTEEGTFDAAIGKLDYLRDLGVTAVQVMPIAQFPGARNWGYDGAFPYAAQNSYGGIDGFRRLVDACHARGLALSLDVVYNHLGPEGNYLSEYAPYFTGRYRTPWGLALNFDGPHSDEVRRYFLGNVEWWLRECHVDALRLDAVHAISDTSAYPFLAEVADLVEEISRETGVPRYAIAESDLNDPRVIRERERGGLGLHGQWSDDFHHALHSLLTRERDGYYADFGTLDHLARAWRESFVYAGHPSPHRGRRHGAPAEGIAPWRFVVYTQNHDQVGNRMLGDRHTQHLSIDQQKLAAGVVLLSPFLPMFFMGQEWGETAPFLYFTSHSDPQLIEAVRRGRREEFARFAWKGEAPDPDAEESFLASKLDWSLPERQPGSDLVEFHRALLALRRSLPDPSTELPVEATVVADELLRVVRRFPGKEIEILFNFSERELDRPDGAEGREIFRSSSLSHRNGEMAIVIPPFSFVAWERPA